MRLAMLLGVRLVLFAIREVYLVYAWEFEFFDSDGIELPAPDSDMSRDTAARLSP